MVTVSINLKTEIFIWATLIMENQMDLESMIIKIISQNNMVFGKTANKFVNLINNKLIKSTIDQLIIEIFIKMNKIRNNLIIIENLNNQ